VDLSDSWPLPDTESLRDELAAAYADESRGYHDTRHLSEVLERLFELSAAGAVFDPVPVLVAAWFHDAVYDGERDAEERSAAWAEDALAPVATPELVAEVARLVRLTETHSPADEDVNGHALSDADLGILAASAERYAEYVAAVRREYAHIDDAGFAAGRLHVLEALAEKPALFHTDYARLHWEQPARENLARELDSLRATDS
jgi:predicted metal-dependent HD superfamily phosphohydrolase